MLLCSNLQQSAEEQEEAQQSTDWTVTAQLYPNLEEVPHMGRLTRGFVRLFHIVLVRLLEGAFVCLWVTLASFLQSWISLLLFCYSGQPLLILGISCTNCLPRQ